MSPPHLRLPLRALCICSAPSSQCQLCAYLHCETCWIKLILLHFCHCNVEVQGQCAAKCCNSKIVLIADTDIVLGAVLWFNHPRRSNPYPACHLRTSWRAVEADFSQQNMPKRKFEANVIKHRGRKLPYFVCYNMLPQRQGWIDMHFYARLAMHATGA